MPARDLKSAAAVTSRREAGASTNRMVLIVGVFLVVALLAGLGLSLVQFAGDRDTDGTAANTDTTADVPADSSPDPDQQDPATTETFLIPDPAEPDPAEVLSPEPTEPPEPPQPQSPIWVNPQSSGQPWPAAESATGPITNGLLTFRGSPTRSWYGTGPISSQPAVKWVYSSGTGGGGSGTGGGGSGNGSGGTGNGSGGTDTGTNSNSTPANPTPTNQRLCSDSSYGGRLVEWCGTGWTGQPAVFEYDGRTWVVFGALDGAVHFLDADSGQRIIPPFQTGDIIKGSVTIDPDGYPLVYFGSRDNKLRAVAFDRPEPEELWQLDAYETGPVVWNDDWDSTPLVIGDYLLEGGENSNFYIIKLNRSFGADGLAEVAPTLEHYFEGWDDELLEALGDREVSIESSVAVSGSTVYFANSGGLVQGWDLSGLGGGEADWQPRQTFRFWMGDDVDATITIDNEGMLYVAAERERTGEGNETAEQRTLEIGQLLKLDPSQPDQPMLWAVYDTEPLGTNPPNLRDQTGFWATPAVTDTMVYAASHTGRLLGIDREVGLICWEKQFDEFLWSSPVVVDGVLMQAASDANRETGFQASYLRAYDVSSDEGCAEWLDSRDHTVETPPDQRTSEGPEQLWAVPLGWRVESTPAVWGGNIYVGDRNGSFYAVG